MKLKILLITLSLFVLFGCGDDNGTNSSADGLSAAVVGAEGTKMTYVGVDGKSHTSTGNIVLYGSGMLLNSNYFRQFRLASDIGTLRINFNINKDKNFSEFVDGTHSIYEHYVLLQETTTIENYNVEVHFTSVKEAGADDFERLEPFAGEITIYKNRQLLSTTYDYSGVINATYKGRKFEAYFWSQYGEF